ncbi:hypothetical protein QWT69_15485 [Sporosarcina oncorhynchi]|uniref:Lipoprotein n=1 Tax=Sporosarcina oncorhynchi TaxID=3056444 RepID=A0ABZ0L5L2_9BACL|nr:hypothetical protein [Sporosarcina sp. T2O-4]WOV87238.1 hypothetical protein QWT69_15485 [Sporosarcina sp. T2O-4]
MKRFLLGVVCVAVILGGCTNKPDVEQSNANQTNEMDELKKEIKQLTLKNQTLEQTIEEQKRALESTEVETPSDANEEVVLIKASEIEKYPQTLYKEMKFDVNGDGEEEIIELYVNAGKMEDGQFAWDDGQNWLLVVKDGEKTYPLFDGYVQMGTIDFSTAIFDRKPGIVMFMRQHGDRVAQKFMYDENESGFVLETFYKKENTQDHYNQSASFAFFEEAQQMMNTVFTTKLETLLEAGEDVLQDSEKRRAIVEPIYVDVESAQRKLDIVGELNPQLMISLDNAASILYQMSNNTPTAEQMEQLKSIVDVFKEIGNHEWVDKQGNRLYPEVKEKLKTIGFDS